MKWDFELEIRFVIGIERGDKGITRIRISRSKSYQIGFHTPSSQREFHFENTQTFFINKSSFLTIYWTFVFINLQDSQSSHTTNMGLRR